MKAEEESPVLAANLLDLTGRCRTGSSDSRCNQLQPRTPSQFHCLTAYISKPSGFSTCQPVHTKFAFA